MTLSKTFSEAYTLLGPDIVPPRFVRLDLVAISRLLSKDSPYLVDDCTLFIHHVSTWLRKRGDNIRCDKYGDAWCWSVNGGADYSIVKEFTTDLTPEGDLEALLKLSVYLVRSQNDQRSTSSRP